MADTTLLLVDLLADRDLGLRLENEADPHTPLRGAHAIEVGSPSRWLKPGWLMLTTGTRFTSPSQSGEQQRELIRELRTAGMAGIAFGVGVVLDEVPAALRAEADRVAFPLLSVPLATPFLDVIEHVHQATASRDIQEARRRVSIQDYLAEAITADDATTELVRRLGGLLRAAVAIYDEDGTVVASIGAAPLALIRAEIAGHPDGQKRGTLGRWHVLTTPLRCGQEVRWLAVASRIRRLPNEVAQPMTEATRRVLAMIERSQVTARSERRLRRAALVRQVSTGADAQGPQAWDRLEMYQFRKDHGLRLVAVTGATGKDLEHAAPTGGTRLLVDDRGDDHLLGVVDGVDASVRALVDALPPEGRCGVSGRFTDLPQGPRHTREALVALAAATRDQVAGVWFDHMGLVDWLLAARSTEEAEAKARQTLGAVLDRAPLYDALRGYLRHGHDVARTARELGIHANSVRYRLRRVGQLLGRNLRCADDLAELTVSLRVLEASPPRRAAVESQ